MRENMTSVSIQVAMHLPWHTLEKSFFTQLRKNTWTIKIPTVFFLLLKVTCTHIVAYCAGMHAVVFFNWRENISKGERLWLSWQANISPFKRRISQVPGNMMLKEIGFAYDSVWCLHFLHHLTFSSYRRNSRRISFFAILVSF